jgi:hypothetical protein
MVLLKHEENNSVECIYDSSNVIGSKYLKNERKLAIIFKSGLQYVYKDVTFTDYNLFESGESQGKLLNTVIKKYSFDKSKDIVDISPIMEQINKLKKNE